MLASKTADDSVRRIGLVKFNVPSRENQAWCQRRKLRRRRHLRKYPRQLGTRLPRCVSWHSRTLLAASSMYAFGDCGRTNVHLRDDYVARYSGRGTRAGHLTGQSCVEPDRFFHIGYRWPNASGRGRTEFDGIADFLHQARQSSAPRQRLAAVQIP